MKVSLSIAIALAVLGAAVAAMLVASAPSSRSNGRIAWSRDSDVFTMNPDGSGKKRLTETRAYETAQWSPDGQRLAVVRSGPKHVRILQMNARGSDVTVLARARFTVQGLDWSPDGSRIAYCDLDISNPDARAPYPSAIKVVDVATGTQSRLTEFADKACSPSWSPDGTQIAFHAGDSTNTDIYVMNADGTNQTALTTDTDARQLSAEWSPTADVIAFERPVPGPGNQGDSATVIETIRVDGTGLRTLTEPVKTFDGGARWSPDGTKLLFYREDITGKDGTQLGVVASDGSGDRLLTSVEVGNYAWSPDSTKIVFGRAGDIFVMNADGSAQKKLVGNKSIQDVAPDWQPR